MSSLQEIIEREEQRVEVKVVIDGKEVTLVPDGSTKQFDKFKEPDGMTGGGEDGKSPLMAKVYVKKGWQPE